MMRVTFTDQGMPEMELVGFAMNHVGLTGSATMKCSGTVASYAIFSYDWYLSYMYST